MSRPQPSSLQLRTRLLALLAVLVAFDVAFVATVYVLAHVAAGLAPLLVYQWEHVFWSLSFDVVPLWPVLVAGTPLTLAVQFAFGYRLTLRDAETGIGRALGDAVSVAETAPDGSDTDHEAVTARVARLAQVADVSPPEVGVIDAATPNSFVASRPGERTLFVTSGLLDTLDGDRLEAVLAHELAHLKNGDSFVMTAAAFLPTVTAQLTEWVVAALRKSTFAGWLFADRAEGDGDDDDSNGTGQIHLELALLVFAAVAVPVLSLLHLASTACYRLLSRVREYAADAGGAAVCGSPAALADALETLDGATRPERDLRTAETGVRELCVLPYAIDADGDDDAGADGDGDTDAPGGEGEGGRPEWRLDRLGRYRDRIHERVLPRSHPDVETRVAALRDRQPPLERAG